MISKTLVVLCCLAVAVLADEKYTDKYDNMNMEEVMENTKLRVAYFKCIMDRGKCTNEGQELKNNIVDAIQNKCKKCTEKQKEGCAFVFKYLIENDRPMWDELCAKFDPDGKWRESYADEAKERGIDIPK